MTTFTNPNTITVSDITIEKIQQWVSSNLGIDLSKVRIGLITQSGVVISLEIDYNFTVDEITKITQAFPIQQGA